VRIAQRYRCDIHSLVPTWRPFDRPEPPWCVPRFDRAWRRPLEPHWCVEGLQGPCWRAAGRFNCAKWRIAPQTIAVLHLEHHGTRSAGRHIICSYVPLKLRKARKVLFCRHKSTSSRHHGNPGYRSWVPIPPEISRKAVSNRNREVGSATAIGRLHPPVRDHGRRADRDPEIASPNRGQLSRARGAFHVGLRNNRGRTRALFARARSGLRLVH
jgi:hypothetical protein